MSEQRPGLSSAGSCSSSLFKAEILRCALCQNVKGKTQEGLKNGGMAMTTKLNHSLLASFLPNAIFYHIEMSGGQNGKARQTPASVIIN